MHDSSLWCCGKPIDRKKKREKNRRHHRNGPRLPGRTIGRCPFTPTPTCDSVSTITLKMLSGIRVVEYQQVQLILPVSDRGGVCRNLLQSSSARKGKVGRRDPIPSRPLQSSWTSCLALPPLQWPRGLARARQARRRPRATRAPPGLATAPRAALTLWLARRRRRR